MSRSTSVKLGGGIVSSRLPGRLAFFRIDGPVSRFDHQTVATHGLRVLWMDDDDVIRTFAERIGRRLGWDLEVSCRGEETLAQWTAADPKPDLVILDVLVRPGLGGIETLSRLRDQGAEVPVLMASAFAPDLDAATLERLGPARRIAKPFKIQMLRELVEEFLVDVQRA